MKTCTGCNATKPRSEFYSKPTGKDGLTARCKDCIRGAMNDRYAATRAKGPANRDDWDETGRRCTACGSRKPWEQFPRRAKGQNGYSSRCKDCTSTARKDHRAANLETARARDRDWDRRSGGHYRKRYGITRDERDAMAEAQGGLCAGCSKRPGKRLVVDHCHRCNALRKLLCDRCNIAMHVLDDPDLLERLLAYRDAHLADGCNPGD